MKQRGFTLIEMIIALSMSLLIIGTIGSAFQAALQYQRTTPERLNAYQDSFGARKTLESLIQGAFISDDEGDTLSYFVAADPTGESTSTNGIVFTTLSRPLEGGYVLSDSIDFEELHEQFGPQGGLSEVSLDLSPVGTTSSGTGLFLRIQTPADGDPTQGGTERLLIPDVTAISYEFWDGIQWLTAWDSINGELRRLPPAIRITLEFEEGDPQYITLRVPGSDVTADNPIVQTTEGAPTGP